MSSEEPKLSNSEADINQPLPAKEEPSPEQAGPVLASETPASVSSTAEEDESRPPGDVDFGQLLDQFEQEQASLQEGEVVRGTVVNISERGVVIDFGYQSDGVII